MSQLELPMPISGLPLDLKALSAEIHHANIVAGWWVKDEETGRTRNRNTAELLALIHSEISEADVGFERGLMDDKLPHRRMTEVELADVAIRVLDMLGFYEHSCVVPGRTLALPEYSYWPDWCRLLHRTTTQALEAFRKGRTDDGCVYLVDVLGVVHFCAIQFRYDLTGAITEKRAFNASRADHKPENRAKVGGKAF
ncbi:MAG: hypothetical protein ABIS14_12815 [Sphingomonas sp.]